MAADRWTWEHGGAQRGPVTLEVEGNGDTWEWHAWVDVAGRERLLACCFDIATGAEAMRAAEEAGDAHIRECVEAAPDEVLIEVLRARGWQMEDLAPTASEREMLATEGLHAAAKVYRDRTGANLATALRVLSK